MRGRVLVVLVLVVTVAVIVASTVSYVRQRRAPVVVDAACPALLPGTSDATDDYGDVVEWRGQTLWRSEQRTTAGEQVGVVGCSVTSMPNPDGLRVSQLPWPDGTATVLDRGTTLHLPQEDRGGPALVARTADGDVLYCPDVENGPPAC